MAEYDNTPPVAVPIQSGSWPNVRVALTPGATNPLTIANGSTVDGLVLATGDRFVCVGTRTDAGIYTVGAGASTRSADADEAADFVAHRAVNVTAGSVINQGKWAMTTASAIVLGSTTLTFSKVTADDETLSSGSYDNAAASAASLSLSGFDNAPAVSTSSASSTTIYYGKSSNANPTEGQAKSDLLSVVKDGPAGTYECAASGYKFLAVPASMTPPTTIRDNATGLAVTLAGSADGYGTTTGTLTHASLVIDGVSYRIYRSLFVIGGSLTLQVA